MLIRAREPSPRGMKRPRMVYRRPDEYPRMLSHPRSVHHPLTGELLPPFQHAIKRPYDATRLDRGAGSDSSRPRRHDAEHGLVRAAAETRFRPRDRDPKTART